MPPVVGSDFPHMAAVSLAVPLLNSETCRGFCRRNFVLPKSPKENSVGSTCRHLFRRQLLDQLGKRFLGPTSGREAWSQFQKEKNDSKSEIMPPIWSSAPSRHKFLPQGVSRYTMVYRHYVRSSRFGHCVRRPS